MSMSEETKPTTITSRVSQSLFERLEEEAAHFKTDVEHIIRVALWEYLKKRRSSIPAIPPDAIWDSIDPDAKTWEME